jgi:hypothetical protein
MVDRPPTNDQAMTKGSLEKVSTLGKFLKSFLELVEDENGIAYIMLYDRSLHSRKGSPY